jgi:glycosyltransferase involved in cell wall biosynthesis
VDRPRLQRPLRILHLTAHSEPGGLSRYIHDLSLAMYRLGHDVRVAGNRGGWHWLFEQAPFPFIEVPLDRGPLQLWNGVRRLRRHLAGHPVDVLHSHYRRSTLVGRRLQSEPNRPPLLFTIHLSDIPMHWRARMFPDFGDHVHVASGETRRWSIEQAGVEPSKISMILHGVQVERFPVADEAARAAARRQFGLADTDRVAAFVGRLDHPKNEDWLLDLADRSRAALPNLKILIAGTGPHEAELRRQVRLRNLTERVFPLGERPDPLSVYQASDALLLPSMREGFSLVTAEAMSVGVPVCRTRTAGSAELIVEGVTGRTTDIDREAFVRGATEFLADAPSLRRMSTVAAAHVRERFTFDRQLHQTVELYYRLAGLAVPPDAMPPTTPAAAPAQAVTS